MGTWFVYRLIKARDGIIGTFPLMMKSFEIEIYCRANDRVNGGYMIHSFPDLQG